MMAELGQTSDPRQLIPGDIHAIRARVDSWRTRGRELAAVSKALGSLSAENIWSGPAADAFEVRAAEWTPGWDAAAEAFLTAASHLDRFAADLDYAQGQAAEAIALYERGVAETAAHRSAEASSASLSGRGRGLLGRTDITSPGSAHAPIPQVLVDPGVASRAAAEAILRAARHHIDASGEEAAHKLRGDIDWGHIFSVVWTLHAEMALEALRATGNTVASLAQAFVDHPELLFEVLGGALMIQSGLAGEAGGIALDATGLGAAAGVPVNVASAGLIVAGVGAASAGMLQAAGFAASSSKVEIFERHYTRGPDGKFSGFDEESKIKEQEDLDRAEEILGGPIERKQVLARVIGGRPTGRYYDGLFLNADGTYTAIEVKTGTGRYKGTDQELFDSLVTPDNPATAKLYDKLIRIVSVKVRYA